MAQLVERCCAMQLKWSTHKQQERNRRPAGHMNEKSKVIFPSFSASRSDISIGHSTSPSTSKSHLISSISSVSRSSVTSSSHDNLVVLSSDIQKTSQSCSLRVHASLMRDRGKTEDAIVLDVEHQWWFQLITKTIDFIRDPHWTESFSFVQQEFASIDSDEDQISSWLNWFVHSFFCSLLTLTTSNFQWREDRSTVEEGFSTYKKRFVWTAKGIVTSFFSTLSQVGSSFRRTTHSHHSLSLDVTERS